MSQPFLDRRQGAPAARDDATERRRPVILAVTDFYSPGFKGGGPIRSVTNLVDHLADQFVFRIVTRDRDLGDAESFPSARPGEWQQVGSALVYYQRPSDRRGIPWLRFLRRVEYDLLYLNSFFSRTTIRTLILRRMGLLPRRPLVLAPRGEFSPQARELKPGRKRWYLRFAGSAGLLDGIVWQASSEHERRDILEVLERLLGHATTVRSAPNLTPIARVEIGADLPPLHRERTASGRRKSPGHARLVFLARIARIKNLDYALTLLREVRSDVELDVYGPLEDATYWNECSRIIAELPPNVAVTYRGQVSPERVLEVLGQYDLLLMPTRAENFGHAILEALTAGCPVMISDGTPWRDLAAAGAGWDLPLADPGAFVSRLQGVIDMDEEEHARLRAGAQRFARAVGSDEGPIRANSELFLRTLQEPLAGGGRPRRVGSKAPVAK
jgi:glycosyltransferase involved in cell wall biosynthesis